MTTISNGAGVSGGPRAILRVEGAFLFVAAVVVYATFGPSWWVFILGFLAPDLSMVAYRVGPRIGAVSYNLAHSTVGPILLGAGALLLSLPSLGWLATIWAAHIGLDRMLGYGLKYTAGFAHTHLGVLGGGDAVTARGNASRFCRN